MYRSASRPSAVPAAAAARRRSPDARIGTPSARPRIGAWVPFPAPGAPRRTTTVIGDRRLGMPRSPDEPLVIPHEQLGLDLLHGLDNDADDDEEARSAKGDGRDRRDQQTEDGRRGSDDAKEERAGDRDPGDDPREIVLGRAARTDAGNEPAVLAQLLRGLAGLERECRVEVGEAYRQQEIEGDVRNRV